MKSVSAILINLVIVLFFSTSYSEQVGVFTSKIPLNSSNNVTVTVPDGVVGLSSNIPISGDSTTDSSVTVKEPVSLFFVVDHSNSMDFPENDPNLNRIKLVQSVVDTLAAYPDKYPNIECGINLFGHYPYYHQSNNPLLEKAPGLASGTYLPLVELGKKYQKSNGQTGHEIIRSLTALAVSKVEKKPIDIDAGEWTIPWGKDEADYWQYQINEWNKLWFHNSNAYLDTSYKFLPTPFADWASNGGTNIDRAFIAAVEAMKRSSNPKENQFIIFISDGLGDSTQTDYLDGLIKTDPIPATYTIFFTKDGKAPALLTKMTNAIKNNGYSTTNSSFTDLTPYSNTSADALVDFVMDSVLTIFKSKKATPVKITIDGTSSTTWSSTTGKFSFPHPLALTGLHTDFTLNLEASLTDGTETTDTSYTVLLSTDIDPTLLAGNAKGTIEWWDRTISIKSGSTLKSSLTNKDTDLSVNFEFDPLKSDYSYSNVDISIRCKNSGDVLTVSCTKEQSTLFTKNFILDPLGAVDLTDNVLTPDSLDEIVFTFRNSESYPFPLDTLVKTIPYTRMKKDVVPTITTTPASLITLNSAMSGGDISSDGGAPVTVRGVCWSTSEAPDTSGNTTIDGSGVGSFVSSLTGLIAEETYYVRAYAINSVGIAYGNQIEFTTTQLPFASLTATPGDTTYTTATLDVLLSTDSGNRIYYTTDGSTPDTTDGTQLLNSGSHTGIVTISGDVTIRAIALGEGYRATSKSWNYTQDLPQLYVRANDGKSTPDTTTFYIDTTVVLFAEDKDGNLVEDAEIYYLIDDGTGPLITKSLATLYADTLMLDTTVRVQAIATANGYVDGLDEWYFELNLLDNPQKVSSFCYSHIDSALTKGPEVSNKKDTILFGTHLLLTMESASDNIEYKLQDAEWQTYEEGDTLRIDEEDDDSLLLEISSNGQGYKQSSMNLLLVRDSIKELVISPEESGYISKNISISAEITGDYMNSAIFFDTSGSYEVYENPIMTSDSFTVRFEARADFAIWKQISKSYYPISHSENAFYFDRDGDGEIDSVSIEMNRDTLLFTPESLTLYSPYSDEKRVIDQEDLIRAGNRVSAAFASFDFSECTNFEKKKLGRLYGKGFSDEELEITDSVAPVLRSAQYLPGEIESTSPIKRASDTLRVIYSEEVSLENPEKPLRLCSASSGIYSLQFQHVEYKSFTETIRGETYTFTEAIFTADSSASLDLPQDGDSVNISLVSETEDEGGVVQEVYENRKVSLHVAPIPYKLLVKALSPVDPKEYTFPEEIQPREIPMETGLLIELDFLILLPNTDQDVSISILDKVGNVVIESNGISDNRTDLFVENHSDEKTVLRIYWSGNNSSGRRVGAGTYHAALKIEDGMGQILQTSLTVGVRDSSL